MAKQNKQTKHNRNNKKREHIATIGTGKVPIFNV